MADASVSRSIAASPDVVWGLVSDVTRMGEWSPETTRGVWLKGATGPAFCFRVKGGPLGVALWEYHIEPEGDGCVVEERWTDERGWLVRTTGKMISGVEHDAAWNTKGMEQTLERLAAVAEAS